MPDEGEEEEEEEEGEEDPIIVWVTLLDDWGVPLSDTQTVELADGASFRMSVIDLFGLRDTGAVQSGWIDVMADTPGLVGSAEIYAFSGETLSAIPLQPVRNSKFVFSHVARGFGFDTGVAVVHSGTGSASVVLELRNPAAELLGTVGPVVLAPGNRLVGLISELFPGAGELSGGTVRVLSDVPVSGVELFYGENQRVLSLVPAQPIE